MGRTHLGAALLSLALGAGASAQGQLPVTETKSEAPLEISLGRVALAGAAATVVSVPGGLLLGSWVGTLSSNLYLAGLPSLLLFAALPPIAVTWAAWLAGNWITPGSARARPAVWVAIATHLAMMAGAIALGFSSHRLGDAALLTLAEALVLPAAVTLTIWGSAERPPPIEPRPASRAVPTLPLASWRF